MKYTFSVLTLIFILATSFAVAGEPSTQSSMTVDGQRIRSSIYEGQSIDWTVTLIDADPVQPTVDSNGDFELTFLGDQAQNSTSIIIINGRRIDNSQKKHIYGYRLTPNKTGELKIPTLTFNVGNGQNVTAGGETLTVKGAESQDLISMKILAISNDKDISQQPVYPMQPFKVVLRIWVKAIPEPHSGQNPMSVQQTPPKLKIPWAADNLQDGLSTPSDINVWLGPYQKEYGFAINDFAQSVSPMNISINMFDDDFGSAFRPRLIKFMPNPEIVTLPDANGKDTKYYQFDFVREFVARKTGSYTFGPVSFRGDLPSGLENDRLQGENVFANAKALTVEVTPPPTEGRPEDYINASGLFDMSATLTPNKVHVGDPLTLTVTIRGQGSFEEMTAPKLDTIPGVTDNFRVYEATDKLTDGQMQFTWSLRPLNDKVKEFPSITASYFDVTTGKYIQMKSDPIPIQVEKGAALLMNTPMVPSTVLGDEQNWKTNQSGVHANITNVNQIRSSRFNLMKSSQVFIWTNGTIYTIFVISAIIILLARMMRMNPVQVKRRHACATAMNMVRQAAGQGTLEEQLDMTARAIATYVADRRNVPATGLTTDDVIRLLQEDSVTDESILNEVRFILEQADAARFGGASNDANVVEKAKEVLKRLK